MTQIRVPIHRLYLDESGDHLYNNLDEISRRYLTILGCIFEREHDYVEMAQKMLAIKKTFWPDQDPDKPIIFHREDMVRKRPPFHILGDPNTQKNFDAAMLDLLAASRYSVINVTIDKQSHQKRYKYPEHPYHYCLQVMLERYAFWLTENSTEGDVMGESRGLEDLELKKEYRSIWQDGTMQKPDPALFQTRLTSKEIKIKPKSSNIPGLQIADLLAYPLREKLLFDKRIRNNYTGKFNETVYKSVAEKIRKSPAGKTAGFGEIFVS